MLAYKISDRAEIGAVSGGVLSVTECNSSAVEYMNSVSLEWHHTTLEEDGDNLKRIFLFSHCINPTNTSMVYIKFSSHDVMRIVTFTENAYSITQY